MRKRIFFWIGAVMVVIVGAMVVCDRMVYCAAKNRLYDKVEDVPHRKVGLVLGTSHPPGTAGGTITSTIA